jgi:hypothetical protein
MEVDFPKIATTSIRLQKKCRGMCELIKLNVVGDYRAEGWNDGLFHFE